MKVFKPSRKPLLRLQIPANKGKEYYRSTGTANRRDAEDIAAAARRRHPSVSWLDWRRWSLRSLAKSQRVCQLFANSKPLLMHGWPRQRTNNREQ